MSPYPNALDRCDICHSKTSAGIRYNGFFPSEPIIDPVDDSVMEPGRTAITLDMPHAAYAGLADGPPALKKIATEITASKPYEAQQFFAKQNDKPKPWTAIGLAQAMLDQQVLKRAFEARWPDRRIGFSAKWPSIITAKGANGEPENHVHAAFQVEGDVLTIAQVHETIAYAAKHYEDLSRDVLENGFSISELETGPFGKAWRFNVPSAIGR